MQGGLVLLAYWPHSSVRIQNPSDEHGYFFWLAAYAVDIHQEIRCSSVDRDLLTGIRNEGADKGVSKRSITERGS